MPGLATIEGIITTPQFDAIETAVEMSQRLEIAKVNQTSRLGITDASETHQPDHTHLLNLQHNLGVEALLTQVVVTPIEPTYDIPKLAEYFYALGSMPYDQLYGPDVSERQGVYAGGFMRMSENIGTLTSTTTLELSIVAHSQDKGIAVEQKGVTPVVHLIDVRIAPSKEMAQFMPSDGLPADGVIYLSSFNRKHARELIKSQRKQNRG